MKLVLIFAIFFHTSFSVAEIYDPDSERHDKVVNCRGYEPFNFTGNVYLSRNSFTKKVELEKTLRDLLARDVEEKSEAVNYEPPKDLHPSEGTREENILRAYNEAFSYKMIAECLVDKYQRDDELWVFDNKAIQPNVQKGYVILRKGKLIVMAVTESLYID